MEEIISNLEEVAKTNVQPDIIAALLDFQANIYSKLLEHLSFDERQNYLKRLWLLFLQLANSQQSSVRFTTCSTITTFLMKIYPYFPRTLRQSFTQVMNEADLDDSSSSILVASFAFLTNFIAPQYLQEFLDTTPIFHHFFQVSALSSERLSSIISNIPWLGDDWFSTVFAAFINQTLKNCSRNTLSAALALFKRSPKTLMKVLLQFGDDGNWEPSYITILAFMISGGNLDVHDMDQKAFEKAQAGAFHMLSKETSKATKSDCFTILSTFKQGLTIEKGDDTHIKIKLNEEEITLDSTEYTSEPKFFLLPLPLSMLETSDSDLPSIIQSKMESLGRMAAVATKESHVIDYVITILDKESKNPENQITLLMCIRKCANNILSLMEGDTRFSAILYRCLFCKESSWFHASEILNTLKMIDHRLYKRAFGENGDELVRRRILQFAMNQNEGLSNVAIKTLVELSPHIFDELAVEIWLDTDFFDEKSLEIHLKIMSEMLLANPTRNVEFLNGFSRSLYELGNIDDLGLSSYIFLIQSFFDNGNPKSKSIMQLADSASSVIQSAIEILTGHHKKRILETDKANKFFEMTSDFLSKNSIDITDVGAADFRKQLAPVYSACRFILSLPLGILDRMFVINSCRRLFKFFPDVCTDFLIRNFEDFSDEERVFITSKIFKQLSSVASCHVHAQWAELTLFPMTEDKLPHDFYSTMTEEASYFIENNKEVAPEDLYSFCALLGAFDDDCDAKIKKFLNNLPIEKVHDFVAISRVKFIGLVNSFPEEFKRLSALDLENSDSFKLQAILNNGANSQEEIDFCKSHLKGIDLILFQQKLENKEHEQKPLREKLIDAMNTRQKQNVETLLSVAAITHEKIDFKDIFIPNVCIGSVMEYLQKWDKEQIPSLLERFSINDIEIGESNFGFFYCAFNFQKAIDELFALEKLSKKHIITLSKCLLIGENIYEAPRIIEKLVSGTQYSKKKITTILLLIRTVIEENGYISAETKNKIINFIRNNEENCDTHIVSRLFFAFATLTELLNASDIPAIEPLYKSTGKSTPENAYLVISLYQTLLKARMKAKWDVKESVNSLMQRNIPSSLHAVFVILETLVNGSKTEEVTTGFKSTLVPLIDLCFTTHKKNPLIINWICTALHTTLVNDDLRVLHAFILNEYTKHFVADSSAEMFTFYSLCASEIVRLSGQFTQLFKDILNYTSDSYMTDSSKLYVACLDVFGKVFARYADPVKRTQILDEKALSWLGAKKNFDSYYCIEFYNQWLKYMMKFSSMEDISQVIVMQFMKHIQRFYFFLVIIKRTINELDNEDDKHSFIENLQLYIPMIQKKDHQEAVTALINGKGREAFDLSLK